MAQKVETRTSSKTERWIFRCKRCKATVTRDYTVTTQYQTITWGDGARPVYSTTRRYQHNGYSEPGQVECPECKQRLSGRRVEGHLDPNHKCDARCLGAVGHICECSCGGKNHGGAYLR